MRPILAALLLVGGVASGVTQHPLADLVDKTFEGRVVRVSDGDTFDVIPAGERRAIRVRVFGIDTPERGEPYSTQARNRARVMLFDKQVTLNGTSIDRYGRLVATVRVGETDLGLTLLSEGLACYYKRYSDDEAQAKAESSARISRVGFWATGAPKPQCAIQTAPNRIFGSETRFIGNTRSRVFHSPACPNADCKNCVRTFTSVEEAVAAGFRAAMDCLR